MTNKPKWANYKAMDYSGHWYWYQNEPRIIKNKWRARGLIRFAGTDNTPRRQWKNTLTIVEEAS